MQRLSPDVPERYRLLILNMVEREQGRVEEATRRRMIRQAFLAELAGLQENGQIALCSWSRDCDMCEGTYRVVLKADAKAVDNYIQRDLENAEGPMRHWLQRPSDPFEHTFRDRALEAYENGHPYRITLGD
jgi:hypothetical protein